MCIEEEAGWLVQCLNFYSKKAKYVILRLPFHIGSGSKFRGGQADENCITASISPRFSLSAVNGLSIVLKGGSVNELI